MASSMAMLSVFLALVCCVVHAAAAGAHLRRRDGAIRRMERFRFAMDDGGGGVSRALASAGSPSPAPARSRVYHVTDYGADPTGGADSTSAIARAIMDAFQPASNSTLISGTPDLGGAEVHLDGGAYLISAPLSLPSAGGGNFKMHGGSLRASAGFPADRYMLELWDRSSSSSASGEYAFEYVTLRDLMLDCGYRGGGIAVVDSLRTTIDGCYIAHFATDGVWVRGGHETFIRNSFVGQHITAGGDPGERNFSGTGINLAGPDNAVTDTVVFSAGTGVLVTAPANTLTGVHCYNKATGWGGVGVHIKTAAQTRIIGSYLDYTSVVAEDPDQLLVTGSFFLGDAGVVLKAIGGVAKAVEIVNNVFSGSGGGVDIVKLDESGGSRFTDVEQVYVQHNVASGMAVRATAAKGSAAGNGSSWTVDFSPVLLFPGRIEYVQYTLVSGAVAELPAHSLRSTSENRVVVAAASPVPATVHVMVDQNSG